MKKIIRIVFSAYLVTQINLNGQNWTDISPNFDYPDSVLYFYNGFFINEDEGWFKKTFPGTLWYTINGGKTWQKQIDSNDNWFIDVQFIDVLHGWIIGQTLPTPDYKYFILRTKDGGKSWNKYSIPLLQCITFFDSLTGFAGGEDSIYSTTDGGVTWCSQKVEPGVRFGISDIYFVDNKNGWAVGGSSDAWDAGIILNTTDGGKYWKVNEHPSGITGHSVYFTDSLHGYVVGSNPPFFEGVIKVTSDRGNNWKIHYLPCTWLNDVVFIDDSTGWVVGNYGFIWHTTDRGITWVQIESSTTSHLYRIYFFNNGEVGYILGSNSTLLKYDKTVGIKDKRQPITSSFRLFQNYPNPFNPSTIIKYQLPENTFVKLNVYNSMGQLIKTLVNDLHTAGTYSIEWHGDNDFGCNVASGIYFYCLITSNNVFTNKMVLVR